MTESINRILVPVDFSAHAEKAVRIRHNSRQLVWPHA
jgi:hypothetical protein